MGKIIAYYRVSTKQQGLSGLGLEGQQSQVEDHARREASEIIRAYTEVETGKRADRPELQKALAHAKRSKAKLVVAKLDRLARNVAFTSALMESGVEFIACDNPHANRLTIHILAAVAEDEAIRISDRTKAALQAAKDRGTKLGSSREGHWSGREGRRLAGAKAGAVASAAVKREAANNAYSDILPEMKQLQSEGLSLRGIAAKLTAAGHVTRNGKAWNPVQVRNVLLRSE